MVTVIRASPFGATAESEISKVVQSHSGNKDDIYKVSVPTLSIFMTTDFCKCSASKTPISILSGAEIRA